MVPVCPSSPRAMAAATSNLAEASAQPSFSSWGSLNVTQETAGEHGAFSIKPRFFKAKKKVVLIMKAADSSNKSGDLT